MREEEIRTLDIMLLKESLWRGCSHTAYSNALVNAGHTQWRGILGPFVFMSTNLH